MRKAKTKHVFTVRDKAGKVTASKEFYVDAETGELTDKKGKKLKKVFL